MPTTPTSIEDLVRRALATAADHAVVGLKRDDDIFDLGLDSLDFWTILMDIEDQTGQPVPAEVLDRLAVLDERVTVGDILDSLSGWLLPHGDPVDL